MLWLKQSNKCRQMHGWNSIYQVYVDFRMTKRSTTTVTKYDTFGTLYRRFLVDQVDGERWVHLLLFVNETSLTVIIRLPFLQENIMNTRKYNTKRDVGGSEKRPARQCHRWRHWKNSLDRCASPLLSVPTSAWTDNGRLVWSVPRPISSPTSYSTPCSTLRLFSEPSFSQRHREFVFSLDTTT